MRGRGEEGMLRATYGYLENPCWAISRSAVKDVKVTRHGERNDIFFTAPYIPDLLMVDPGTECPSGYRGFSLNVP